VSTARVSTPDSATDAKQRFGASSVTSSVSRVFYVLRRWPVIPGIILGVLIVSAIFAPLIAPHDPLKSTLSDRLVPPAWFSEGGQAKYLLGTDHIGRDLFSRMVHGARVAVVVMTVSLTIGVTAGTILGLVAGYYGHHVDEIIMRIVDTWAALPFIMVALVVILVFGQSFGVMIALLALLSWPGAVRLVRAEVLTLRTRDYVALAKVAGASTPRILFRHVLPSVWNVVLVTATLQMGGIILVEATLSFLGAGIPAPTPAWGAMTASGKNYLNDAWWVATAPGVAISVVVLAGNFLGDWLRDRLDPTIRQLN
jgi:peptide/nickel transport system permease protein